MSKTAAEAEREVEASRGELDRTMEALRDKMTPGQLLDEAMRTMGGAGQQIVSKFMEQAKANPMPLAVMGVGLAWLMSSNGSRPASTAPRFEEPRSFAPDISDADGLFDRMSDSLGARAEGVSDRLQDAAEGLSGKAQDLAGRASDAASSAGDRLSSAAEGAMQSARQASDRLSAMASDAAGTAGEFGRQAQKTVSDLISREPLIIGGAGLLAGLALGAALPPTDAERRYMGPVRDKVVDKAKALAEDRLEDVKEAAQVAYDGAKGGLRSLSDEAGQGGELAH